MLGCHELPETPSDARTGVNCGGGVNDEHATLTMRHARDSSCRCHDTTTVCPECGFSFETAVPFNRSGREAVGRCEEHDAPIYALTDLQRGHFVDERGFLYCEGCGYVFDDEPPMRSPPVSDRLSDHLASNHYARIVTEHGFTPRSSIVKRALTSKERTRIARLAGVLADAETLLSALDVRGDLKAECLTGVEAYFASARKGQGARGGLRYEFEVCAVVEEVLVARGVNFDAGKVWEHFSFLDHNRRPLPLDASARTAARRRVASWFQTYNKVNP